MLSKLTLKKSKQTEKLKVITFFSVAHFGLLLPKTRLILAPIWPFLKNFWFRFRLLKDNSMMMINSTDFASNLQKNRKMWTISYLLRWINNYRVLLLVYLECMELKNVFYKKAVNSSIGKVPFSKNISGMTQCPSNPGFASTKVQNVDFLKKPSVGNTFFSSLMFS